MIIPSRGDLFVTGAQTLVNPVNCVGVMGKGLALAFKKKFPGMFADYRDCCRRREMRLGQPILWKGPDELWSLNSPWVLNFPTKDHWRDASKLEPIDQGLQYLSSKCEEWGVTSMAMPALGCGLGGLSWSDVRPLVYKYLDPLDIDVFLFGPK